MPGQRMRRVNEAVREVLSEAIAEGLKDPRIGFVTVVSVDTSADLRLARVYISVLGDEQQQEQTLAGLERSRGFLQSLIARQLGMKRTPQLTFLRDESIDRGMRIEKLLREHESGEQDSQEETGQSGGEAQGGSASVDSQEEDAG